MIESFEKFGFVKDDELLLNKFNYKTKETIQLFDESGNIINVQFIRKATEPEWTMLVFSNNNSSEIKLPPLYELRYDTLDINPDGFKEIILFYEYYISNNELYNLIVYEIS